MLDFDPTELNTEKTISEINTLKKSKHLDFKNSKLSFKRENAKFHLLPKIHKANNLGRPVISSVNCHTGRKFRIC